MREMPRPVHTNTFASKTIKINGLPNFRTYKRLLTFHKGKIAAFIAPLISFFRSYRL